MTLLVAIAALIGLVLIGSAAWLLQQSPNRIGTNKIAIPTATQGPSSPTGIYLNQTGKISRANSQNGQVIWSHDISGWGTNSIGFMVSLPLPLASGNIVVFYKESARQSEMRAYNATTGQNLIAS